MTVPSAHVVAAAAFHAACCSCTRLEEVATADHDGDLDTAADHLGDLAGHRRDDVGIGPPAP